MEPSDTPRMAFFLLSLSVRGMGFVCGKYQKGPFLSLFTAEGDVGFSTEHPGCLFIYSSNIWTAVLCLALIQAGSDVFCQQIYATIWVQLQPLQFWDKVKPQEMQDPITHRRLNPAFEIPDPLQQKFRTYCGFPLPIVLHPCLWKGSKIIFMLHFWRGKAFLEALLW